MSRSQDYTILKVIETGRAGFADSPAWTPVFHLSTFFPKTGWPLDVGPFVTSDVHHTVTMYGHLEEIYDTTGSGDEAIHRVEGIRIKHEFEWTDDTGTVPYSWVTDEPIGNTTAFFNSWLNGGHEFQFRAWARAGGKHEVDFAENMGEPVPFTVHTGNYEIQSEFYLPVSCETTGGLGCCGDECPVARLSIDSGPGFARIRTKMGVDLNYELRSQVDGLSEVKVNGPLNLSVTYKPKYQDGAPVEGKSCYLVVGALNAPAGHEIEDGDWQDYIIPLTVPVEDHHIEYGQEISHSYVYGYGVADDGPAGFRTEIFVDLPYDKSCYSHLNYVELVWAQEELGLPAPVNAYHDVIDNTTFMRYGNVRYHPAAGCTAIERSTLTLPQEWELTSEDIDWWSFHDAHYLTRDGDGFTTLTTVVSNRFEYFQDAFHWWELRPFRYFEIEYKSNETIEATVDLGWSRTIPSGSGRKLYNVTFPDTDGAISTIVVDMLNPDKLNLLNKVDLPLLDDVNQAQTDFMPATTGGAYRFGGFGQTSRVTITFENASMAVRAMKGIVRTEAKIQPMRSISTNYTMFGQVDYHDAFRVDADDLGQFTEVASAKQHIEFTTIDETRSANCDDVPYLRVSNFDEAWERIPEGDLLTGAPIKCTATGSRMYLYAGISQDDDEMIQGSEPFHLDAEYLWGHAFHATAVPKGKDVVHVEGNSLTWDFQTNAVTGYVSDQIPMEELVTHTYLASVNGHAEPRPTIPVLLSNRTASVNWIGFAYQPNGGAIPSYDVSDSMRHYRSYAKDGTLRVGKADNAPNEIWLDIDTGIAADSSALRVERQDQAQRLWLMYSTGGEIELRSSSDEGATFEAPISIGTGNLPALLLSRKGLKYLYWVDDVAVRGQIRDASNNIVKATFTAVPSVPSCTSLVAGETMADGGQFNVSLIYASEGNVRYIQSPDGVAFT